MTRDGKEYVSRDRSRNNIDNRIIRQGQWNSNHKYIMRNTYYKKVSKSLSI